MLRRKKGKDSKAVERGEWRTYMWRKAKKGISKQINVSWIAKLSISIGKVEEWMMPVATRIATPRPCQKEKKMIPLTQRNLGTGLSNTSSIRSKTS